MFLIRTLSAQPRLIALLSGFIFPFAIAPFFISPLIILSLMGLLFSLQNSSAKEAALRTWLFGLGKFSVGVSWIYVSMHDHGGTPAIIAILMVALFAAFLATFPALFMYFFQRFYNQENTKVLISIFAFSALWFSYEWFRSWFMTGFPWLFAGDAQLYTWLNGWAPILSVYGLSFFSALTAATIYYAVRSKQTRYLIILIIWPIGFALQNISWTEAYNELKVSAVQGNIAQEIKWLPEQRSPTINAYLEQTRQHWDSDLILWPETAITILKDQFQAYLDTINQEAINNKATLITGIPFRYTQGPYKGEFHNSILAIGTGEGLYHKQKLVPFGEYIPLEKVIRGLLPFFDLPMSSFKQGGAQQDLLKAEKDDQLYLIAPFICYEIVYPEFVANMAKNSDMLITISNDAWFGDSLGPKQHMAIAQMRALETRRFLLRSTNTGITALVNHKGEIIKQLPTEERATLTAYAQTRQGLTPFMRFGLWPLLSFSLFTLILGLWYRAEEINKVISHKKNQ
ncbi:MAG: apolipoprotein N-acyltransferase [Oleispira sp.]|nr:apolipoprotein N-acyltransferase [Oleispira sp.]